MSLLFISYLSFFSAKRNPITSCRIPVDVGFIFDTSAGNRSDHDKKKMFLKSVAASFLVAPKIAKVGVNSFSRLIINLKDHNNILSFNDAVDNIPYLDIKATSSQDYGEALRLAQQRLFTYANGGRDGVPKLLIVIVNASQINWAGGENPVAIAKDLQLESITISAVVIGNRHNETKFANIAGELYNAHIYNTLNYDELITDKFIFSVKKDMCGTGNDLIICKLIV